jgi:hypothetical protein
MDSGPLTADKQANNDPQLLGQTLSLNEKVELSPEQEEDDDRQVPWIDENSWGNIDAKMRVDFMTIIQQKNELIIANRAFQISVWDILSLRPKDIYTFFDRKPLSKLCELKHSQFVATIDETGTVYEMTTGPLKVQRVIHLNSCVSIGTDGCLKEIPHYLIGTDDGSVVKKNKSLEITRQIKLSHQPISEIKTNTPVFFYAIDSSGVVWRVRTTSLKIMLKVKPPEPDLIAASVTDTRIYYRKVNQTFIYYQNIDDHKSQKMDLGFVPSALFRMRRRNNVFVLGETCHLIDVSVTSNEAYSMNVKCPDVFMIDFKANCIFVAYKKLFTRINIGERIKLCKPEDQNEEKEEKEPTTPFKQNNQTDQLQDSGLKEDSSSVSSKISRTGKKITKRNQKKASEYKKVATMTTTEELFKCNRYEVDDHAETGNPVKMESASGRGYKRLSKFTDLKENPTSGFNKEYKQNTIANRQQNNEYQSYDPGVVNPATRYISSPPYNRCACFPQYPNTHNCHFHKVPMSALKCRDHIDECALQNGFSSFKMNHDRVSKAFNDEWPNLTTKKETSCLRGQNKNPLTTSNCPESAKKSMESFNNFGIAHNQTSSCDLPSDFRISYRYEEEIEWNGRIAKRGIGVMMFNDGSFFEGLLINDRLIPHPINNCIQLYYAPDDLQFLVKLFAGDDIFQSLDSPPAMFKICYPFGKIIRI